MNPKIQELIASEEKILFIFDFDGTMLEAQYGENTILGCKDDDSETLKRDLEGSAYDNVKPLKRVQKMVRDIYGNNKSVKVLTKIHNSIEVLHKMKYLHHNYPQIKIDDFIGVTQYEQKATVLEYYSKKYDRVVYIDDYLEFILTLEDMFEDIDNIKCFHVSSLFID